VDSKPQSPPLPGARRFTQVREQRQAKERRAEKPQDLTDPWSVRRRRSVVVWQFLLSFNRTGQRAYQVADQDYTQHCNRYCVHVPHPVATSSHSGTPFDAKNTERCATLVTQNCPGWHFKLIVAAGFAGNVPTPASIPILHFVSTSNPYMAVSYAVTLRYHLPRVEYRFCCAMPQLPR